MSKQPKISIIIPVYNAEKYLTECLQSVQFQSFTDFEVLLVNDGSTDRSGKICEEFVEKDSRFKVFHKENGGVSSARNLGIKNASGEFICFIDSDDYIKENFFKDFKFETNSADLFVQGYHIKIENQQFLERSIIHANLKSNDIGSILCNLEIKTNIIETPWSKLFKTNIIHDNNLLFNERLHNGEDHLFVLSYFKYINSIYLSNSNNYIYNRADNPDSLINQRIQHHNFGYYNHKVFDRRIENYRIHNMKQEYKDFILTMFHANIYRSIKLLFNDLNERQKKKYFQQYMFEIKKIEKDNHFLIQKRGKVNHLVSVLDHNFPYMPFLIKLIYKYV
ncbi:glycosyltransferase family 2 protein [Epilithonimonas hispanica]|uniref:Glycosyltransferase 2-like domain-containing protein n=1 Tax=Epilithonimonas hispanica TaxID=358687 RepID=A0A3D9CU64_9FLAO|nr:glycosyltransferase family 2 protein [Epilithonimonas hispanica]REC69178.1 hypothetical protein DRF58_12585 [Epilithonimonas hispanica]